MHPGGSVPSVASLFRKLVVSFKYDGVLRNRGWRWWSTNTEMRSVGAPQKDTMGLPGMIPLGSGEL